MNILVLIRFSKEVHKEETIPLIWAKFLKVKYNAKICALTMDSCSNKECYQKCFEFGADRVIMLSDKKFAGADTLSTSRTIARAIEVLDLSFDIILTAASSTFGETGQIPVSVSNFLGITYGFNVVELQCNTEANITIIEAFETFSQATEVRCPILLSMSNSIDNLFYRKYQPTIYDILKSLEKEVEVYHFEDLHMMENLCGLSGSYTRVVRSKKIEKKRQHLVIDNDIIKSIDELNNQIYRVKNHE